MLWTFESLNFVFVIGKGWYAVFRIEEKNTTSHFKEIEIGCINDKMSIGGPSLLLGRTSFFGYAQSGSERTSFSGSTVRTDARIRNDCHTCSCLHWIQISVQFGQDILGFPQRRGRQPASRIQSSFAQTACIQGVRRWRSASTMPFGHPFSINFRDHPNFVNCNTYNAKTSVLHYRASPLGIINHFLNYWLIII